MSGYQDAEQLLKQNLELLQAPLVKEQGPISVLVSVPPSVLFNLSKALLLLTESLQADLATLKETRARLQPPQE